MRKGVSYGLLLFFFLTKSIQAIGGGELSIPCRSQVETALFRYEQLQGPLSMLEGEVLDVDDDVLTIGFYSGKIKRISLPPACQIFVNGQPGSSYALRPISPGFPFIVRLYYDSCGCLGLIDGWYVGVSVKIVTISKEEDFLVVQALEGNQIGKFLLAPALKPHVADLAMGSSCFLLLNWEQEIIRFLTE